MSALYPRLDAIQQGFGSPYSLNRSRASPKSNGATPRQARPELYAAYSAVEDKAKKLSAEAAREFEKASQKAQAKTGHIELFSGKYYAACTFGGMLACVGRNSLTSQAGS